MSEDTPIITVSRSPSIDLQVIPTGIAQSSSISDEAFTNTQAENAQLKEEIADLKNKLVHQHALAVRYKGLKEAAESRFEKLQKLVERKKSQKEI